MLYSVDVGLGDIYKRLGGREGDSNEKQSIPKYKHENFGLRELKAGKNNGIFIRKLICSDRSVPLPPLSRMFPITGQLLPYSGVGTRDRRP